MGRSNRIVASRILSAQLQPLQNQLQTLQTTNNQLNAQLAASQTELNTYQGMINAGQVLQQRQQARFNLLSGAANVGGSILNIQGQIAGNTAQVNVIQPQVQNLNNQITGFGLTNPANTAPLTPAQQAANAAAQAAGQPLPHPGRPLRADEQNY